MKISRLIRLLLGASPNARLHFRAPDGTIYQITAINSPGKDKIDVNSSQSIVSIEPTSQ